MKTNEIKPGRIYSFVYVSDVEMVSKREFRNDDGTTEKRENPLGSCLVTVRRVVSAQAAGNETYRNVQLRKNPDWQPSEDRKSWYHVSKENDCIVEHNNNGQRYLRAIPRGISKEEYFIGKVPATEAEVETIRAFKKGSGGTSEFVVYKLENLANLEDSTDYFQRLEQLRDSQPSTGQQ